MDEKVDLLLGVRLERGEELSDGLIVQQVQRGRGGKVWVQDGRGCTGEREGQGGYGLIMKVVGYGSAEDPRCS